MCSVKFCINPELCVWVKLIVFTKMRRSNTVRIHGLLLPLLLFQECTISTSLTVKRVFFQGKGIVDGNMRRVCASRLRLWQIAVWMFRSNLNKGEEDIQCIRRSTSARYKRVAKIRNSTEETHLTQESLRAAPTNMDGRQFRASTTIRDASPSRHQALTTPAR